MELLSFLNENTWKKQLITQFEMPYFKQLQVFLQTEFDFGKNILPTPSNIFNAYNSTPFNKVKVVIIGQDPYHGVGQAHGLCFSVQSGIKPPPSLVNIFKEIRTDLAIEIPQHGCLQKWAAQGVFLLNSILTVEANKPASHQKRGWEEFTNATIKSLSENKEGVVFLLWGNYAQQKSTLIDNNKHTILCAPHPSPFSAHSGFLGCKHFSQVNKILIQQGQTPIDWNISPEIKDLFS